jgi:hypothetical protein
MIGSAIISLGTIMIGALGGYFLSGLILQRKINILIPWENLIEFGAEPSEYCLGLSFEGTPACSPIIFRSHEWAEAMAELRQRVPNADITPNVLV